MSNLVVCIGDNCVDMYDTPGRERFVGGNAVNTAVHARETGCGVSYVGCVGNDDNGRAVTEMLAGRDIDVSHVRSFDEPTAWTRVVLENGERQFPEEYLGPAGKYDYSPELLSFLQAHRVIHNTWQGGTEDHLADFRKPEGPYISLDYGERYSEDFLKKTVGNVDLAFFSSDPEDERDMEAFMESIHEKGPACVIVTCGRKGAWCSCPEDGSRRRIFTPAKTIEAVDTLGAGDTFIGTFLGYFAQGYAPEACMKKATEAAAANCLISGGFRDSRIY
ncbi:MAG: hypothetical protein IKG08_09985 [Eubacterium sp.]|nr:hypothetical protein [Eubacterium sp.]